MKVLLNTVSLMICLGILAGCSSSVVTQSVPTPTDMPRPARLDEVMNLNRLGEWKKAVQVTEQYLNENPNAGAEVRCELYYDLAYAQNRLGDRAAVRTVFTKYDADCGSLNGNETWVVGEMNKLRTESEAGAAVSETFVVHEDGFWQVEKPETFGLDVTVLEEHRKLCEDTGAQACLVIYQGKIVQEWYADTYQPPLLAMSSTKSVTSLLVGMLLDEGRISSIDEPVCSYIESWCTGIRAKVTLKHLLSMTSGLEPLQENGVGSASDKDAFVLQLMPKREPGTAWQYSNEGAQLLSPILDRAAGEPIQDYARKHLFEPLGMQDTHLNVDAAGHAWTYADMITTPRDFARIGQLMLNRGHWGTQTIVSETWVRDVTSNQFGARSDYGLLWWLFDRPKGFAAVGYLDTNLYVFPESGLLVVRMQNTPGKYPDGAYAMRAMPLLMKLMK